MIAGQPGGITSRTGIAEVVCARAGQVAGDACYYGRPDSCIVPA